MNAQPAESNVHRAMRDIWPAIDSVPWTKPRVRMRVARKPEWRVDDETGEQWFDDGIVVEHLDAPF